MGKHNRGSRGTVVSNAALPRGCRLTKPQLYLLAAAGHLEEREAPLCVIEAAIELYADLDPVYIRAVCQDLRNAMTVACLIGRRTPGVDVMAIRRDKRIAAAALRIMNRVLEITGSITLPADKSERAPFLARAHACDLISSHCNEED